MKTRYAVLAVLLLATVAGAQKNSLRETLDGGERTRFAKPAKDAAILWGICAPWYSYQPYLVRVTEPVKSDGILHFNFVSLSTGEPFASPQRVNLNKLSDVWGKPNLAAALPSVLDPDPSNPGWQYGILLLTSAGVSGLGDPNESGAARGVGTWPTLSKDCGGKANPATPPASDPTRIQLAILRKASGASTRLFDKPKPGKVIHTYDWGKPQEHVYEPFLVQPEGGGFRFVSLSTADAGAVLELEPSKVWKVLPSTLSGTLPYAVLMLELGYSQGNDVMNSAKGTGKWPLGGIGGPMGSPQQFLPQQAVAFLKGKGIDAAALSRDQLVQLVVFVADGDLNRLNQLLSRVPIVPENGIVPGINAAEPPGVTPLVDVLTKGDLVRLKKLVPKEGAPQK